MIDGVAIRKLKLIPDGRGYLIEGLRSDWPEAGEFGQVYATSVYPGVVKAWHRHKAQTDRLFCVYGMAKIVLHSRGEVNEFTIGLLNPALLVIPPGVWHGFAATGSETAVIVNVPDKLYNYAAPDEERLPADAPEIPYDWKKRDG